MNIIHSLYMDNISQIQSAKTIKKIKEFNLPEMFEIVIVPDSNPKTKPKNNITNYLTPLSINAIL